MSSLKDIVTTLAILSRGTLDLHAGNVLTPKPIAHEWKRSRCVLLSTAEWSAAGLREQGWTVVVMRDQALDGRGQHGWQVLASREVRP